MTRVAANDVKRIDIFKRHTKPLHHHHVHIKSHIVAKEKCKLSLHKGQISYIFTVKPKENTDK